MTPGWTSSHRRARTGPDRSVPLRSRGEGSPRERGHRRLLRLGDRPGRGHQLRDRGVVSVRRRGCRRGHHPHHPRRRHHWAVVRGVFTYRNDGHGKLASLRAYWEFDALELVELERAPDDRGSGPRRGLFPRRRPALLGAAARMRHLPLPPRRLLPLLRRGGPRPTSSPGPAAVGLDRRHRGASRIPRPLPSGWAWSSSPRASG